MDGHTDEEFCVAQVQTGWGLCCQFWPEMQGDSLHTGQTCWIQIHLHWCLNDELGAAHDGWIHWI